MSFCKRSLTLLSAFAVMALGVFSFMIPAGALAAPTVDVQPFFLSMPQLPDGYFDGDILANGDNYQLSLDFSNLSSSYSGTSSESGTIESEGMDRYTITVPATHSSISDSNGYITTDGVLSPVSGGQSDGDYVYYGTFDVEGVDVNTGSYTATVSQSAAGDHSYSGSSSESGSSDYSGSVSGSASASKDFTNHYRFLCFSIISGGYYRWFIYDCRNSDLRLQEGHEGGQRSFIVFYYSGSYPFVYYTYGFDGSFQGYGSVSSGTTFGTDYFWFSDSVPPSTMLGSNNYFRFKPAVFGKDTLLFSYLNTIHSDLNTLHSDIQSLQTSMQSAISNQTTTFQNMDAASGFDPTSVDNMLEYGSLESNYHAPSTDQLFSVSGGTYTDGMAFWRDRMNELLYYSGSPILGLTTFVMTLGLAALVIGRRISGGGSA